VCVFVCACCVCFFSSPCLLDNQALTEFVLLHYAYMIGHKIVCMPIGPFMLLSWKKLMEIC
jgi:hypothetical protein